MTHRSEPSCCCAKLGGPGCEHDSRVPPMPLLLMGGDQATASLSSSNEDESTVGSDAELTDEDSHRERMEPLIAFQRKMARCVTVCTRYKNFIQDDVTVNRAAQLCPCRLVEERPAETAEEKLTKRLAVVLFLAGQWHDKEAGRHDEISDVQDKKASVTCSSSNVREVSAKKD